MLKSLFIQNYALIDSIKLEFNAGLNVITGETGAGKSILIGALGLILGNRADSTVLNQNAGKCIIEGTFDMTGENLERFLQLHELDIDPELHIRREINAAGKSRAFINDTPVALNDLKDLASLLVDVNSQNQTYVFKSPERQLEMLDELSNNQPLLAQYRAQFAVLKATEKQLHQLKKQEQEALQQNDFIQFQFDELSQAHLVKGEEELIKEELQLMDNAEVIKQTLFGSSQLLNDGDDNLISKLELIINQLHTIDNLHADFKGIQSRLQSCLIELQDVSGEFDRLNDTVDFDPERHVLLQDRMDMILRLQQKHRKQSVEELIKLLDDLDKQLVDFGSLSDLIIATEQKLTDIKRQLKTLADTLSKNRKKGIAEIEQKVIANLRELGMKDAQFKIDMNTDLGFTSTGTDEVHFLFSSNKGRAVELISKIASGGELSRLVLTLKSLLSESKNLPTVIFDEIDTGVSGDIASKVGNTMKSMANNMQVIAITHLPQIAAKGEFHYKVFKKEVDEVVQSDIQVLNAKDRLSELALMLSGDALSATALKMAKELML